MRMTIPPKLFLRSKRKSSDTDWPTYDMGVPQVDFVKAMALVEEIDDRAMAVRWVNQLKVPDSGPLCATATASD